MKNSQNILSALLALTLNGMFSFGGTPSPCDDGFLNSLGLRNDLHIFVGTSDLRNQSVMELLNNSRTERRRRANKPTNLSGSTLYFEIVDDDVLLISCPPTGETDEIEMEIEFSIISMEDCVFVVNYTVVATEPDIIIPDSSSVVVNSSVGVVDIVEFTLANEGPCTNFMCSVTCNNADKTFWIVNGTRMIRTEAVNITYNIVFELTLTCTENNPVDGMNKTSAKNASVTFLTESPWYLPFSSTTAIITTSSSTAQSTHFISLPWLAFLACLCCYR